MTKFMNERMAEHGTVHIITILWMQQVRILSPDALKAIAQSNVNIRKCTPLRCASARFFSTRGSVCCVPSLSCCTLFVAVSSWIASNVRVAFVHL